MTQIQESKIKMEKATRAKKGTREYKQVVWKARLWNAKKNNWAKYTTSETNRDMAVVEALNYFRLRLTADVRALNYLKTTRGIPTVRDLFDVYDEVCAIRPEGKTRRANKNHLLMILRECGMQNPLAVPVTHLNGILFENWFSQRLNAAGDQVEQQDHCKRSLFSYWRKVKSIIKKRMIKSLECDYGWDHSIVKHLKDLPSRVSTEDLNSAHDEWIVPSQMLISKTWDEFENWKHSDPNGHILFLLGFMAGLRMGEALHVRWDDLLENQIKIQKHGNWNTKNRRSRVIDVPHALIDQIREFYPPPAGEFSEYCICHPSPKREVWVERKGYRPFKQKRIIGGNPCTKTERSASRLGVGGRVNSKLQEIGWDSVGRKTGAKFHKLRGLVITKIIQNEGIYMAQCHAGHRQVSTTINHYAGVARSNKDYLANSCAS